MQSQSSHEHYERSVSRIYSNLSYVSPTNLQLKQDIELYRRKLNSSNSAGFLREKQSAHLHTRTYENDHNSKNLQRTITTNTVLFGKAQQPANSIQPRILTSPVPEQSDQIVTRLSSELSESNRQIHYLKKIISKNEQNARTTIVELQSQLRALRNTNEQLNISQSLEQLGTVARGRAGSVDCQKCLNLQNRIRQLEKELAELTQLYQLEKKRNSAQTYESSASQNYIQRLRHLQEQLSERTSQIQELSSQNTTLRNTLSQLQRKDLMHADEYNLLLQQFNKITLQKDTLYSQYETLFQTYQQNKLSLQQLSQLLIRVKYVNDRLNNSRNVQQTDPSSENWHLIIEQLENSIAYIQQQLQQKNSQITQLQTKITQDTLSFKKLQEDFSSSDRDRLRIENDRLTQQLRIEREQTQTLTLQFHQLQQTHIEINNQYRLTQQNLNTLQQKQQYYIKQINRIDSINQQLLNTKQHTQNTNAQLNYKLQQLNQLQQTKNQYYENKLTHISIQITQQIQAKYLFKQTELQRNIQLLQQQLRKSQQTNQQLINRNKQLQNRVQTLLERTPPSPQKSRYLLQIANEELTNQVNVLQRNNQQLQTKLTQTEQHLLQINIQIQELQTRQRSFQYNISATQQQKHNLERQLATVNQQLNQIVKDKEDFNKQNIAIKEAYENTIHQLHITQQSLRIQQLKFDQQVTKQSLLNQQLQLKQAKLLQIQKKFEQHFNLRINLQQSIQTKDTEYKSALDTIAKLKAQLTIRDQRIAELQYRQSPKKNLTPTEEQRFLNKTQTQKTQNWTLQLQAAQGEIDFFRSKLIEAEDFIVLLTKQKEALQTQTYTAQQNQALKGHLSLAEAQINRLAQQIAQKEKDLKSTQSLVQQITLKLQKSQNQLQRLSQQLTIFKRQTTTQSKTQVSTQNIDIFTKKLKDSQDKLKLLQNDKVRAELRLKQTTDNFNSIQASLQQFRSKARNAQNQIILLEEENRLAELRIQEANSQLEEISKEVNFFKNKLDYAEAYIRLIETAQNTQAQVPSSDQISQIQKLKAELALLEQKSRTLEAEKTQAILQLQKSLQALRNLQISLDSEKTKLKQAANKIAILQSQRLIAESKLVQLERLVQQSTNENTFFKDKLREAEDYIAYLQSLKNQVEGTIQTQPLTNDQQKIDLVNRIFQLQEEKKVLQQLRQNSAEESSKRQILLKDMQQTLSTLNQKIQETEARARRPTEQNQINQEATQIRGSLQTKLRQAEFQINSMKQQVIRLTDLQASHRQHQQKILTLQSELLKRQEEIQFFKNKLLDAETYIAELQNSKQKQDDDTSSFKQNTDAQEKIQTLQYQIKIIQKQKKTLEDKVAPQQKKIETYCAEVDFFKKKLLQAEQYIIYLEQSKDLSSQNIEITVNEGHNEYSSYNSENFTSIINELQDTKNTLQIHQVNADLRDKHNQEIINSLQLQIQEITSRQPVHIISQQSQETTTQVANSVDSLQQIQFFKQKLLEAQSHIQQLQQEQLQSRAYVQMLQSKLKTLIIDIANINDNLVKTNLQKNTLIAQNKDLLLANQTLKTEIDTLKQLPPYDPQKVQLKSLILSLQRDIDAQKNKNSQTLSIQQQQSKSVQFFSSKLQEAELYIQKLQLQRQNFSTDIQSLKQSVDPLKQQFEHTHSQLILVAQQKQSYFNQLKVLKGEYQYVKSLQKPQQEQIQALSRKVETLQAHLQTEEKQHQQEVNRLNTHIQQLQQFTNAQNVAFQQRLSTNNKKLSTLQDQNTHLQHKKHLLNEQATYLRQQFTKAEAERAELRLENQQLSNINIELRQNIQHTTSQPPQQTQHIIRELRLQLAIYRNNTEQLNNKITSEQKSLTDLQQQKQYVQQQLLQQKKLVSKLQTELQQLQQIIQQKDKRINDLQIDSEVADKIEQGERGNNSARDSNPEFIKQKLLEAESYISEIQNQNERFSNAIETMRQRITILNEDHQILQEKLAQAEEDKKELIKRLKVLQKQIDELRAAKVEEKAVADRHQQLQNEQFVLRNSIQTLTVALGNREAVIKALETEKANLQKKIQEVQSWNNILNAEVHTRRNEIESLQQHIETLQIQSKNLNQTNFNLIQDKQSQEIRIQTELNTQIQSLTLQLQSNDQETRQLKITNFNLQQQLREFQTQLQFKYSLNQQLHNNLVQLQKANLQLHSNKVHLQQQMLSLQKDKGQLYHQINRLSHSHPKTDNTLPQSTIVQPTGHSTTYHEYFKQLAKPHPEKTSQHTTQQQDREHLEELRRSIESEQEHKISQLQTDMQNLHWSQKQLKNKIQNNQAERQYLLNQLRQAENRIDELTKTAEAHRIEQQQLALQNELLSSHLSQAENRINNLESSQTSVVREQELGSTIRKIIDLTNNYSEQAQTKPTIPELDSFPYLSELINSILYRLKLSSAIDVEKSLKLDKLAQQNQQLKSTIDQQQHNNSEVLAELVQREAQNHQLSDKLNEISQEVAKQNQQIRILERQLNHKKSSTQNLTLNDTHHHQFLNSCLQQIRTVQDELQQVQTEVSRVAQAELINRTSRSEDTNIIEQLKQLEDRVKQNAINIRRHTQTQDQELISLLTDLKNNQLLPQIDKNKIENYLQLLETQILREHQQQLQEISHINQQLTTNRSDSQPTATLQEEHYQIASRQQLLKEINSLNNAVEIYHHQSMRRKKEYKHTIQTLLKDLLEIKFKYDELSPRDGDYVSSRINQLGLNMKLVLDNEENQEFSRSATEGEAEEIEYRTSRQQSPFLSADTAKRQRLSALSGLSPEGRNFIHLQMQTDSDHKPFLNYVLNTVDLDKEDILILKKKIAEMKSKNVDENLRLLRLQQDKLEQIIVQSQGQVTPQQIDNIMLTLAHNHSPEQLTQIFASQDHEDLLKKMNDALYIEESFLKGQSTSILLHQIEECMLRYYDKPTKLSVDVYGHLINILIAKTEDELYLQVQALFQDLYNIESDFDAALRKKDDLYRQHNERMNKIFNRSSSDLSEEYLSGFEEHGEDRQIRASSAKKRSSDVDSRHSGSRSRDRE